MNGRPRPRRVEALRVVLLLVHPCHLLIPARAEQLLPPRVAAGVERWGQQNIVN